VSHTTLLVAFFSTLLGAFIFYHMSLWYSRLVWYRRMRRGAKGEVKGERILRRHGYRITGTQTPIVATIFVDGKRITYKVRPDAVVRKGSKMYIAEVKAGKSTADPLFSDTRRQVLEYYHNSPADGVLLICADEGTIKKITFPSRQQVQRGRWAPAIITFVLGIGAGLLWNL
jgi:hypothetical protein